MGISLNWGPFWGPSYKGAVLYWGPKNKDHNLENYPYHVVWGGGWFGFAVWVLVSSDGRAGSRVRGPGSQAQDWLAWDLRVLRSFAKARYKPGKSSAQALLSWMKLQQIPKP